MTSTRLAGVLVAGALALAGCGSESSHGGYANGPATQKAKTPPSQAPGTTRPQVTMANIAFKPDRLTARVGETVRWTNQDGVPHTVTAKRGASFASKVIQPGQSFSYKLTRAGTVDYVCTIHPNMKASIRVVE